MSIFNRTLEEQYAVMEKELVRENERQNNPFGFPTGFFKVRTVGGEETIGFYCPKCKNSSLGVHTQVWCCGRMVTAPNFGWLRLLRMKTYKMAAGRLLWI